MDRNIVYCGLNIIEHEDLKENGNIAKDEYRMIIRNICCLQDFTIEVMDIIVKIEINFPSLGDF